MTLNRAILCLAAFAACLAADAAGFEAGKGIANDRATGANPRDVTFVTRGGGNPYGWRGWNLAVGGTLLHRSFPNEESKVYGLRLNLGWGEYAETVGFDLGAFSLTSNDAVGVQANLVGNAVRGTASGLQIGLVNYAENLNGVQIGLVNLNRSGWSIPIVNICF